MFTLTSDTVVVVVSDSQRELDNRRLLSTSGVRRKKLSSGCHRGSPAGDSDDDDEDDEDDSLTDINDCRCQLCHKICFLSAVSSCSCVLQSLCCSMMSAGVFLVSLTYM